MDRDARRKAMASGVSRQALSEHPFVWTFLDFGDALQSFSFARIAEAEDRCEFLKGVPKKRTLLVEMTHNKKFTIRWNDELRGLLWSYLNNRTNWR